ncbi:MAG: D-aminoacyl-tRNA deacylase [Nitrospirota bacterium]|nr:D-aminoacyl-tRNA deacylase [Nitrospirota bacterium]
MLAVVQRVSRAAVIIDGRTVGSIDKGLLVLVCAVKGDGEKDVEYLAKKISQLRIFEDESGKMNRSVSEAGGKLLVVSQFTLAAQTRKGNRPSFDNAEAPGRAQELYEAFVGRLRATGIPVETGIFAAMMSLSLVNEGPVTVPVDSRDASCSAGAAWGMPGA